ncbi:hypothetical protein SAMN05421847_2824 [Halpernia humi]|uniref:DUF3592 domain-containing protein n=1 Tax=Halpernia humi TaxID=493375 RepID=A0A1H6BDB3_9FLAO|nr:hypothetical protein [Halpernia humi]SEG58813.1 hypothetical protein SAMN05421847_2824 [Halpernia humi]
MKSRTLSKIFLLAVFLYFLYAFFKWPIQDYYLNQSGVVTMGKIINERGNNGTNGHFLKENNGDAIVYCYSFNLNGKTYTGDSQSSNYKIGDTIKVIYIKSVPSINRPFYYLKQE